MMKEFVQSRYPEIFLLRLTLCAPDCSKAATCEFNVLRCYADEQRWSSYFIFRGNLSKRIAGSRIWRHARKSSFSSINQVIRCALIDTVAEK